MPTATLPPRTAPVAVALLILALPALTPSPAAAASSEAVEGDEVGRGRLLFRIHCASCHGADGRGGGPVAEVLKKTPPDLTAIARRRDGAFSSEEVARIIDGRAEIRSHGGREMPVWGASFQELGRDDDRETEIAAKIAALVAWLRSIQEPPEGVEE